MLRAAGLRLTYQRIALAKLLGNGERQRVSAEVLYSDVLKGHVRVSRATVGNALRQFERVGVLRRIAVPRSKKAWFVIDRRVARRSELSA
ncbi:MAG TPA: transcriptional repressor [Pseudolabrys sp.]|nr:transcriptional repressor [Pseudolabrys sp.]